MVALAQRPCNPCRGGVEPLTREQCAPYLTEVPDWELTASARRITRRFQFRDYRTALAFANAVSALAEETWHHPELTLGGLLRGIVDHPEDRRLARIRFRDGGSHRWPGLEPTRFRLATAATSTEEGDAVARAESLVNAARRHGQLPSLPLYRVRRGVPRGMLPRRQGAHLYRS